MPKRVIDFDAMWGSDKLAACADWAQAEYAWLYGLADASGCFEMTNLRVIWGRVAAVRGNFTIERLEQVLLEFQDKGLLFAWEHEGKTYAHWTGSDVPGRLPPPSWRMRLEKFAPPVPKARLAEYMSRFARGRAVLGRAAFRGEAAEENVSGSGVAQGDLKFEISNLKYAGGTPATQSAHGVARGEVGNASDELRGAGGHLPAGRWRENPVDCGSRGAGLKDGVEEAQEQDLGLELNLDLKRDGERELERGRGRGDGWAVVDSEGSKNSNAGFNSNSTSNANSQLNLNSNANAISESNSSSDSNSNSNPNSNALTGFNANALRKLEAQINSRMRSEEPQRVEVERGADGGEGCNSKQDARFRASTNGMRFAAAHQMSAREMAVERELRVGTGPVCGPVRIRPEVLERIRLREEKWAKERAVAAGDMKRGVR